MRTYIGAKIISAEPMTEKGFFGRADAVTKRDGYAIEYRDGYRSWCPKEEFELAYREVTQEEMELMRPASNEQGPSTAVADS